MAMGFFVAAHRKLRDVRAHDVAGQFEIYVLAAGAALFPIIQLDFTHVGHEIDLQLAAPELSFAAEIFVLFGRKTVSESEGIAKDEIQVAKQVHHERRVGHGKISGRGVALAVEVLVMGIDRNCKETSRMPLESVLLAVFLPNRSRSMSIEDIDHLFVKMLLLF